MNASAIIPTYNRCTALRRTLISLQEMKLTSFLCEIIVVDNGSTDQTRQVVDETNRRDPARPIRYLFEPVPGLLSGRHRGALEAKGDILAFLDDDVRVGQDWLVALEEAFQDPRVALAGGPSFPLYESTPPEWLAEFFNADSNGLQCHWLSLFDGGACVKEIDPCNVWGLNYAIRKEVLFDLGGFHPDSMPKILQRFQGDGETGLSAKLKLAGLVALYHPSFSVQHEVPTSRMTIGYFVQRSYYQSVANSYTQIRQERGVTQTAWSWMDLYCGIKKSLSFSLAHVGKPTAAKVRTAANGACVAGYRYHQAMVRSDPKLLEWVLKSDYFDYRLPGGWGAS